MLKITAIFSLILVGSTLWAAGLSCDSCGSECAAACGTRHFRSCCFNYLRKKRGPDSPKVLLQSMKEPNVNMKLEARKNLNLPIFAMRNMAEPMLVNVVPGDMDAYSIEEPMENRIAMMYDF